MLLPKRGRFRLSPYRSRTLGLGRREKRCTACQPDDGNHFQTGTKVRLGGFLGLGYEAEDSEAIMGQKLVGVEIGKSPIKEDCYVEPEKIRKLIAQCKGRTIEARSEREHRL